MDKYDNQGVFHNRYLLYDDEERARAWRLDISSYKDKRVVLRVNGRITTSPIPAQERLLKADIEMQRAFAEFMIAANAKEGGEPRSVRP